MNQNDDRGARFHDPDAAPDLSRDGWPQKFATARPKASVTIPLSREVIDHFRAGGRGWQTRIDRALREWIKQHGGP